IQSIADGTVSRGDVQATAIKNLDLLTSGVEDSSSYPKPSRGESRNPTDVVLAARFDSFLRSAEKDYDLVVLDSPPVLWVSEGPIMAARAEGAIVVARCGYTKKDRLSRTLDEIREMGGKIFGIVVLVSDVTIDRALADRARTSIVASTWRGVRRGG